MSVTFTLFESRIGPLALAVRRESGAISLTIDGETLRLTLDDASRLASAGRRIEGALDCAAQRGEPIEEAPFFRRQLGSADGRGMTFEIGIDASGPLACVYLEWSGKRIIDSTGRLLKALSVLGEATATVRQASAPTRVQDIRINPETFRSPYGWNGQ